MKADTIDIGQSVKKKEKTKPDDSDILKEITFDNLF